LWPRPGDQAFSAPPPPYGAHRSTPGPPERFATCRTRRNTCANHLCKTASEVILFPLAFPFFSFVGLSGWFLNVRRILPRRTPSFHPFYEIFNSGESPFRMILICFVPKIARGSRGKTTSENNEIRCARKNKYRFYSGRRAIQGHARASTGLYSKLKICWSGRKLVDRS
jgi:hypothetical protein